MLETLIQDATKAYLHKLNGPDDATIEDAMKVAIVLVINSLLEDFTTAELNGQETALSGYYNKPVAEFQARRRVDRIISNVSG